MELIIFLAGVIVFLIGFFVKGIFDQKKRERDFIIKLKENFGKYPNKEYKEEQYQNIAKYFLRHKGNYYLDDITWNDLDMDTIFMLMNHTNSSAGEEYLYHRLRSPKLQSSNMEREEELIQYFMKDEEKRIQMQCAFAKMGKTGKYSIYDYLEYLDVLGDRRNDKHLIALFLYIPAIAMTFLLPAYGVVFLVLLIIYNMLTYSKEKSSIQPYFTSFFYVTRAIKSIDDLQKLQISAIGPEMDTLLEKKKLFRNFLKRSRKLITPDSDSDPMAIFVVYFKMITHYDLILFNSIYHDVKKYKQDIDEVLTAMGYLEFIITVGCFRQSLETYCVPEFSKTGGITATNLYHPLIVNPVKNSFSCNKGVLLTGSNASGKSTFLKTVAINAVLAQSVHTALADSFTTDFFRIYSSMSLQDSLETGDSYYMVEIKALKRILDAASEQSENPILCFVDEVLRGTNTVERIAASRQILKHLEGDQITCFAATHDIELTHMLEKEYDNYHFEEDVVGDDIVFPYLLLEGRATTRNAIKLLSIIGFEKEIIEHADATANQFLETGKWE